MTFQKLTKLLKQFFVSFLMTRWLSQTDSSGSDEMGQFPIPRYLSISTFDILHPHPRLMFHRLKIHMHIKYFCQRLTVTTRCKMDLRKYPLDSQVLIKSILTLMIIFIMISSIERMTVKVMMSWFYNISLTKHSAQFKSVNILGLSCAHWQFWTQLRRGEFSKMLIF